jgi:hypothetical protein
LHSNPEQLRSGTTTNTNIEKQSILNNKIFIATLSEQFRISSNWRDGKAKRFGHDGRNAEASERLLELASEIIIPDDVWESLEPLVADPACLAAISETNRDVGFRKHPRDFADWLQNLHSNLTRA